MNIRLKRQVMFTLDDATLERLMELGTNKSAIVREAIEEFYNRKKGDAQEGRLLVQAP